MIEFVLGKDKFLEEGELMKKMVVWVEPSYLNIISEPGLIGSLYLLFFGI